VSRLRTARAELLVECLDLAAATGVDDARWEHFQLSHLNDNSTFRIENKSRQIAWSWLSAAEAVAEAALDEQSSVFVSINQEEAKEKIRYGRIVYKNLHGVRLPALKRDNELMLEFDNGARLISLPAKPPRGKARFNIYLDEFAHVAQDRAIYTAAMPILSKGGRIRIGSSPMGASGVFWELFSERLRTYPGYTRKRTPWWEVQAFCKNVREARRLAPAMPTAHRVELFGRETIQAIYANLPEEDFRQEYEAEFVDETTAWITWEEIQANQDSALICFLAQGKGKALAQARAAIDSLATAMSMGQVERVMAGGLDIGRTRNASELAIVGLNSLGYPLRAMITLEGCEFDDQEEIVTYALARLSMSKLLVDQNGIGRNLAENLAKRFPGKVEGVDFTNPSKTLWATDAKMLVQQRKTPLPVAREIAYQIHSIKKTVTAARNLVFDTERNEKHHADKFWAWALGLAAGMHKPHVPKLPVTHSYVSY
jgi:phage FluMu gp28-like protein